MSWTRRPSKLCSSTSSSPPQKTASPFPPTSRSRSTSESSEAEDRRPLLRGSSLHKRRANQISVRTLRSDRHAVLFPSPVHSPLRYSRRKPNRRRINLHIYPSCLRGHHPYLLQRIRAFDQHAAKRQHHEHAVEPAHTKPIHILLQLLNRHISPHVDQQRRPVRLQHAQHLAHRRHGFCKVLERRTAHHKVHAFLPHGKFSRVPMHKHCTRALIDCVLPRNLDERLADVNCLHIKPTLRQFD